jgi:hypothetical protein
MIILLGSKNYLLIPGVVPLQKKEEKKERNMTKLTKEKIKKVGSNMTSK